MDIADQAQDYEETFLRAALSNRRKVITIAMVCAGCDVPERAQGKDCEFWPSCLHDVERKRGK